MGWAQGRLDDIFGGLLSWRAFDRCLLIASLYPVFLLLAWVLGAAPSLGGAVEGAGVGVATLIALYALLPCINAGFDWLSWAASRFLLRRLLGPLPDAAASPLRTDWGWRRLLGHGLVDAVAALVLLAGVALTLPAALQLWNLAALALGLPLLEWWAYLAEARADPFGGGIFVTAMLLSTLLPTAAHALALLLACTLPVLNLGRRDGRPTRLWRLIAEPDPSHLQRLYAVAWLFICLLASLYILAAAAIVLEAAIWVVHGPTGVCLADAAQWVGQHVDPPLPAEATSYLAVPSCPWVPG